MLVRTIFILLLTVKRDGKLYDKHRHTFEFTKKTIHFDIVWFLPYSDLPSVFQRYITSKASGRAATQLVSNPALTQMLTAQEAQDTLHALNMNAIKETIT